MNKIVIGLAAAFLLSSCSENNQDTTPTNATSESKAPQAQTTETVEASQAVTIDKNASTASARETVKALGAALKGELSKAMKEGGPLNALTVCNEKAPALSTKVSTEHGMTVSRVSAKNRNPNNAPNDWQTSVLADFEKRKAAGDELNSLEYAEVVGKEFRYMKAIPTAGVCLNCHGAALKPVISDKINALYPDDKAVGFMPGDIRGAFVAVKSF